MDNDNATAGNDGVDEGFLLAVGIFSQRDAFNSIPANRETDVLALVFRAKPDASPGVTSLSFLDGAQGTGDPVPNLVVSYGEHVTPDAAESLLFINGRINIVPDVTVFIGGDSNGDDVVDISDTQTTLGYLFLGDARPSCYDAADADDDGDITITDAIFTLRHLFLSGPPIPPPSNEPGNDPTPDHLGCLSRS